MRATLVGWIAHAKQWGLAVALALIAAAMPIEAAADDPSPPADDLRLRHGVSSPLRRLDASDSGTSRLSIRSPA